MDADLIPPSTAIVRSPDAGEASHIEQSVSSLGARGLIVGSPIPATVYIITLNCEKYLRRTLQSVKNFAEVVIVDSGSTDRTEQIAHEFGCRFQHQDWLGFARQKALALSLCQHEWVLNLDGDEELSPELREELRETIAKNDPKVAGLEVLIVDYFLGAPARWGVRPITRIRFFRKSRGKYDEDKLVHESITLDGHAPRSHGMIWHYGEDSIAIKVRKANDYSELRAQEKSLRKERASLLRLTLVFPLTFFKSYFLRRSFLNGRRGFINSMINAFYAFLKEAKVFEKKLPRSQGE